MSVAREFESSTSYLVQAHAPAGADAVAVAGRRLVADQDRRRVRAQPGTCRRRSVRALPRLPRSGVR